MSASAEPQDVMPLPQLAGIAAVSRRLGVEEATLRKWARDRFIPGFKIGELWMFDVQELAAWLTAKRNS